MGKQIKTPKEEDKVNEQEQNTEINKKPLSKFLPHHKYMIVKQKLYKKRLSDSIKNISLDKNQIKKAVQCLCKYSQSNINPTDLTSKQQFIYLQIIVSKIPQQHSIRPIQIKIPVPIYSKQNKTRFTIITSDQCEDEFTQKVDSLNTPMLRQIMSYQKLRKNYKQVKDKKQLLAANDLFFCDWKIYNLLRQPLGKLFYQDKKFPFPINCDGEVPQDLRQQFPDYESYINGLANYTYTMLGNGPVYSIKVGRTKMSTRQLVKNIMHASYSLIANIIGKTVLPQNIRQINIKTYNSPSLPIYNFLTKSQISSYTQ